MNISAYLIEFLKIHGSVEVPALGIFSLEKSKAVINADSGSILPPASRIVFEAEEKRYNDKLADFIASKKSVTKEAAQHEINTQVDFWKKKLQAEKNLEVSGLGIFVLQDGKISFKGERLATDHPDFYGLEEIRFAEINSKQNNLEKTEKPKDYQLNKSVLWIFLIIIPILGMLYFGYTQREILFGKKSFDSVSVQNKTHRIETAKPLLVDSNQIRKKDSLQRFRSDSLQQDSIKKAGNQSFKTSKKWQK